MSEQYYPSISSLIKIDELPEQLNFLQTGVNGLTEVFDKLSNNGVIANIKLSEVLEHYYGQTVPSDNNTNPSHYSKRFTIFCKANGLLNSNNEFELSSTKKEELIDRIRKFTVFYFFAKYDIATRYALISALYLNFENINLNDLTPNSLPYAIFSIQNTEILLDKFLLFLELGYESEI